ncbi:MAG TPA: glycosyltransferase family 9 protein [Longimicrobiales bacterium]|nr:glycosyltransferase family 9 protein [Longimicrobiales bacterium]
MALRPDVVSPQGPAVLPESEVGHVCIVLLSGIGDVVHGLPLALDLKDRNPDTRITWVAEAAPAQVLRHHPAVDRIVEFDSRGGIRGVLALRKEMADVRADLTLNIQRYLKSVWPTWLSAAPIRVGLAPSKTSDGIRFAHTHVMEEGPWKHSQDLFLDFRGALGIDRGAPVRWDLTFSAPEQHERRAFFGTLGGRPVAALVVASANPKKDWAPERYARLADALDRDFGFQVILLGGPSERERRAVAVIRSLTASAPVEALTRTVRQLMLRVAGSSLVVAPDTGPLHIAHALNVPVVGMFAHTNPWRVGPWRRFHDLVVDRYTEPGDEADPAAYLPKDGRMDTITVSDVLAKVEVARSTYL